MIPTTEILIGYIWRAINDFGRPMYLVLEQDDGDLWVSEEELKNLHIYIHPFSLSANAAKRSLDRMKGLTFLSSGFSKTLNNYQLELLKVESSIKSIFTVERD